MLLKKCQTFVLCNWNCSCSLAILLYSSNVIPASSFTCHVCSLSWLSTFHTIKLTRILINRLNELLSLKIYHGLYCTSFWGICIFKCFLLVLNVYWVVNFNSYCSFIFLHSYHTLFCTPSEGSSLVHGALYMHRFYSFIDLLILVFYPINIIAVDL